MAKSELPDLGYFKQYLSFDDATGVFRWLPRPLSSFKDRDSGRAWHTRYCGKRAGTICNGYVRINIGGQFWLAHRLAWLFHTGGWPLHQIDHKNGIRHDNRPDNLRDATALEQRRNQRRSPKNQTGVTGVRFSKGRFQAEIGVNGKMLYLGRFKSLAEAALARKEAEILHGFHGDHGR